jgi:hypothetical protein
VLLWAVVLGCALFWVAGELLAPIGTGVVTQGWLPRRRVALSLSARKRGNAMRTIISVFINQAPWYIKQRVKTVTELARHSSENTHSLSPRPTKTGKGIIRMDDT